ncbi:response regulator [Dyadobacter sp. OTU695]|uniref:response regulator n=1 Tax=Dyadobacter sp. OTU695 TaxID=3043860 RepID=UPI00313DC55E
MQFDRQRRIDIFVGPLSNNNMNQDQTIHLADDDEDDRMLIKDALEEINPKINVIEAENGEELVDNVKRSGDLGETMVMVDMNMPKKNGIEAIQEIRSEPKTAEIPTVMLSTSNSPELKRKALAAGASDFIVKPNNFGTLVEILKGVLVRLMGRK